MGKRVTEKYNVRIGVADTIRLEAKRLSDCEGRIVRPGQVIERWHDELFGSPKLGRKRALPDLASSNEAKNQATNFTEPGDGTLMDDFPAPQASSYVAFGDGDGSAPILESMGIGPVLEAPFPEVPGIDSPPYPRPGAEPIPRPQRKLSRRDQAIEARRRQDVGAQAVGREDIDYSSDELPSAPREFEREEL